LYGLKPYFRAKFCVDPATHKWWTSFDALIAHISAYLSDDVPYSEIFEQELQDEHEDDTDLPSNDMTSSELEDDPPRQ
jgi:hypothetical protein